MKKIIIAAVSQNGVIGNSGSIPWHSKEDFKHFKDTTMGSPIIMGRKNFESLKQPLKGRLNIVITRNKDYNFNDENVIVVNSVREALSLCESKNSEKAFIIGGGEIYSQTINIADELIISRMNITVEGDTFFPAIDENIWKVVSETNNGEFSVLYYVRINAVRSTNV